MDSGKGFADVLYSFGQRKVEEDRVRGSRFKEGGSRLEVSQIGSERVGEKKTKLNTFNLSVKLFILYQKHSWNINTPMLKMLRVVSIITTRPCEQKKQNKNTKEDVEM